MRAAPTVPEPGATLHAQTIEMTRVSFITIVSPLFRELKQAHVSSSVPPPSPPVSLPQKAGRIGPYFRVSDKNPGLQEKREAPTVKENENLCLFFFADLLKITKC